MYCSVQKQMLLARGYTALLQHSILIGVLDQRQAKKCLLSNTSLIFMKGHRKIKKNPKSHFYKTSYKSAVFKSILSSSFLHLHLIHYFLHDSFVIDSDYDAKVAMLRFN